MVNRLNAKVVEKRNLASRFWLYKLEFESDYIYEAGQYVSVKVNEVGLRRSYSIASKPGGRVIELLVDIGPGGPGSIYFSKLMVGESVEVMGPVGRFVLKKESGKKKLFIATGSGIAPIRAMVQECEVLGAERRLVWGMRFENDLFWQKDMGAEIVLSKPSETWQGLRGHVGDVVSGDLTGWEVYLCGNVKMVEEMVARVKNMGVLDEDISFEKFGPPSAKATEG